MTSTYQIVVGVDGSDGGRRALAWAVQEAAQRGGAVQAVAAWQWDGVEAPVPTATDPRQERERVERMLAREIEAVPEVGRAGVTLAREVVEGRPAEVLSAAAVGADLLVLGSHGHGRLRHTVLGSVSEECVRRASCPVVVVPVPHPAPAPAEPAVRS